VLPRGGDIMAFVIKTAPIDPEEDVLSFARQKTMYGGKHIAEGDTIFVFASESEGGSGLVARGIVTSARGVPRDPSRERQTPRVTITVRRTGLARRRLGRDELRPCSIWNDGRSETELNFKLYRQATNKVVGISDGTAAFLEQFFQELSPSHHADPRP